MNNRKWIYGLMMAALFGCNNETITSADSVTRDMTLEATTKTYESGASIRYDIGTIKVPENRSHPGSRLIDLQFHRFAASDGASSAVPPVYILKGGPGFDGMESKLVNEGHYGFYIEPYLAVADVVVVEHRGFGALNNTPCAPLSEVELSEVDTLEERLARFRDGAIACRDDYLAQGTDLSGYTIREMATDIIEVADALGHREIQLMGNSFGSHWAMTLMRDYPERIARATLSALEGPDATFDLPLDKQAALNRLAREAERTLGAPTDSGRGYLAEFSDLINTANDSPIRVSTVDPRTDIEVEIELTGDDLKEVTQGYSRGTAWGFLFPIWAKDMHTMLNGDLSAAARRIQYVWLRNSVPHAAYFSLECASGASESRQQRLTDQAAIALIPNDPLFESDVCNDWPADLGADFREPFVRNVPALLMHGTYDTSTPLANASHFRALFPNHHYIEIVGGSHGANIEAMEQRDTFLDEVIAWMQTGDYGELPETIELAAVDWEN